MHSKARYSSDVTVELVKHSASDHDVAFAARVSTQGERSLRERIWL
jgi:thymidylate synthase (FAD)